MKERADQTRELFQSMQPHDWFDGMNPESWTATILRSLGLTGWGKWLAQIRMAILTGFVFLKIGIGLMKYTINRLMNSLSSVGYIPTTTLEEDYIDIPQGNVKPQGGVKDRGKNFVSPLPD